MDAVVAEWFLVGTSDSSAFESIIRDTLEMEDSEIIVVRVPNQRHSYGLVDIWRVMWRNVTRSRSLIWQLFKPDFTACYKKSFIGFTWVLITPLLGIVSWVLLQRAGLLKPGETSIPYPAYVLLGSTIFGLFVESFRGASQTLLGGASFILQVNYPREALLFQQLANQIAKFIISFSVNIIVLLMFGVVPNMMGIVLFPFVVIPIILLASALGLITSMFAVVAVDLSNTITIAIGMLIYCTPVIFVSSDPASLLGFVTRWNPLTYLVCSARDMIICGELYSPLWYWVCSFFSLFLFLISWRLFFVSEDRLVERVM